MGRELVAGTSGERAANATNPRRWWRGGGMGGGGEGGHLAAQQANASYFGHPSLCAPAKSGNLHKIISHEKQSSKHCAILQSFI